ncbi:MAG: tetratricopeptide repeat protein [Myxococcota bacterium]
MSHDDHEQEREGPGEDAVDQSLRKAITCSVPHPALAPALATGSDRLDVPAPRPGVVAETTHDPEDFEALCEGPAGQPRLGRYAVLGTLGRGGMGTVLDAFDRTLDRRVALKVLHQDLGDQRTRRLLREARAMAKLSHPNVVQVYEAGQVNGQTFVAMELVKGQTLAQWMHQEPRPGWRQCVEVFLQAGEGLAAAHAHGLVHRDFKPHNAIVEQSGRVRVLDFGLARQVESQNDEGSTLPEPGASMDSSYIALSNPLTRTGAMMGTPAYMPPEQMRGRRANMRSDQFSFCVSLYEAVYGERPYEGEWLGSLTKSMAQGRIRPAPLGTKVPRELRRVLLRGLSPDPARRWPSMTALLVELRRIVTPRSRRWIGAGILGGLTALGVGLAYQAEVSQRCTGATTELAGVWDPGRRDEIEAAMLGTELAYADQTHQRVRARLSEYAREWAHKYTEVCEATAVRREQSDEEMSLRMGCLRERKAALNATAKVLAQADPQVMERAIQLGAELPALSQCDRVDRLRQQRQRVPPPEDPLEAAEVQQLRERLAEIEAERDTGRYPRALEQLAPVLERAEALGYMPLLAEAKQISGTLRQKHGQYAEAERELARAYALATEYGHDPLMFEAAKELAYVVGYRQARHDQGLLWAQTALPLARRSHEAAKQAAITSTMGAIRYGQGHYEDAEHHYRRALELRRHALGEDHPLVANDTNDLGRALLEQGRYDDAEHSFHEALKIQQRTLGEYHPRMAYSINKLGQVNLGRGRLEEAKHNFLRALEIQQRTLSADHPDVASSTNNLGNTFASQEKYGQAERWFRRTLEIRERALGAHHPFVADSANNLGTVLLGQGRYTEAQAQYQRAQRIQQRVLGPQHPSIAVTFNNLGNLFFTLGQHARAETHYRQALEVHQHTLGDDHPNVAASMTNLGNVLRNQGKHAQAEQQHRRALAIYERALGTDHLDVALGATNLATSLLSQGKYEEARAQHRRALAIYQSMSNEQPSMAYSVLGLARIALAQRQFETACEYAEQAVSIRQSGEVAPHLLADARFVLARALWADRTQLARARTLAEQARDTYAAAGDGFETNVAKIEQWLRQPGQRRGRSGR